MEVQRWIDEALRLGFTAAAPLDPSALRFRADVRAACAADACRAYGKNWTCPPYCGEQEECEAAMHCHSRGILFQTVGQTRKVIDTRAYRETEQRHLALFHDFCAKLRAEYPDALCLGSGGCRICAQCAWPEPCRFPDLACSSMEGYGLFVTEVCRACGLPYHHGEHTITYTACVLF